MSLFVFVTDMIVHLHSIRMGEIFALYWSGESWKAENSLSGQTRRPPCCAATTTSTEVRLLLMAFEPDRRLPLCLHLHLHKYRAVSVTYWGSVIMHPEWLWRPVVFEVVSVWWEMRSGGAGFSYNYSLHSPCPTTWRSSCSIQARTCSSHSFVYVLPSLPHTGCLETTHSFGHTQRRVCSSQIAPNEQFVQALSVEERRDVSGEKISEKIHLVSDLAAGLLYSLCLGWAPSIGFFLLHWLFHADRNISRRLQPCHMERRLRRYLPFFIKHLSRLTFSNHSVVTRRILSSGVLESINQQNKMWLRPGGNKRGPMTVTTWRIQLAIQQLLI